MSGKGDNPRPIDEDKYKENYDRIFGKKEEKKVETPTEPFHIRNAKYMIKRQEEYDAEQKRLKKLRDSKYTKKQ